jgi:hypothetical protein
MKGSIKKMTYILKMKQYIKDEAGIVIAEDEGQKPNVFRSREYHMLLTWHT